MSVENSMRTRADVVDALAGLNVQDRQWIVDRLSPHARRALLDEQSGRSLQAANAQNSRQPDQAPAKPPTDLEVATGSLESAAGESLAEVLCNEPTWITHALLSNRAWPWRATLLRELPARMRSELSQLDICMTRYSSRLVESLLVGVATQVSNAASRDAAGSEAAGLGVTDSSFEKIVRKFGAALSRNRLRLGS